MSLWLRSAPQSHFFFEDFFHQVNALLRDFEAPEAPERVRRGTWPRANITDKGEAYVVRAALPGLSPESLSLQVTQEGLTLSGERKLEVPEGYSVHRQERTSKRFSRTFTLPAKVDPEKVEALFKDGILSVTLPRVAALKPRQIEVKVG